MYSRSTLGKCTSWFYDCCVIHSKTAPNQFEIVRRIVHGIESAFLLTELYNDNLSWDVETAEITNLWECSFTQGTFSVNNPTPDFQWKTGVNPRGEISYLPREMRHIWQDNSEEQSISSVWGSWRCQLCVSYAGAKLCDIEDQEIY